MVSSYKGTENNEQSKRLILTANQTTTSYSKYYINGVFRNECAKIDYARRNGTLYRADGIYGELIAIFEPDDFCASDIDADKFSEPTIIN